MALAAIRHHRDRLAVLAAADIEGVAAQAANQHQLDMRVGAADVEVVVAFERVDDHFFQAGKRDKHAGAKNALVVDDHVVAELGADHRQGVVAVAAVDLDWRVERVRDHVGALPAIDVGARRLGIARVDLDEGANPEGVVIVLAVHRKIGKVVIDGEGVIAGAAVKRGGLADAVAEVAARGQRGRDEVFRREASAGVARRVEQLADLEIVVAGIAVNRQHAVVVVEHEGVVALAAMHGHAAIDAGVADLLHVASALALAVEGHRRDRMRTEEEGVVPVAAVDHQLIDAQLAAVSHINERAALAGQRNRVLIAAGLAVQRQRRTDVVLEGLGRAVAQIADHQVVVARTGMDVGRAANAADDDLVVELVFHRRFVTGPDVGEPGVGAVDIQPVIHRAQRQRQVLETAVDHAATQGHAEAADG